MTEQYVSTIYLVVAPIAAFLVEFVALLLASM